MVVLGNHICVITFICKTHVSSGASLPSLEDKIDFNLHASTGTV